MSGRRRTQARRALSFFVSAFVGVLLLASPLAWGEGLLSKGEQSSVSTQQKAAADGEHKASGDNQDTNTSDAHEVTKAPDADAQNKTADTDKQSSDSPDSKADAVPAEAGQAEVPENEEVSPQPKEADATTKALSSFRVPIKVGGKDVSCLFTPTTGGCWVGAGPGTSLVTALADKNAVGDVELPETVMNGKSELKVIGISQDAFKLCPNITSTGLAGNHTITHLSIASFGDCKSLKSAGLQNSAVVDIEDWAFAGCTSMSSTGLEENFTIESIGPKVFYACRNLGKQTPSVQEANLGDLVLNAPANGAKLTVGASAFYETGYSSIYIASAKDKISVNGSAFSYTSSPTTIYLPASWWGTTLWMNHSIAKGDLVIMSPVQMITAVHKPGTSDIATVTLTATQSFEGKIAEAQGQVIQTFSATKDNSSPTQALKIDTSSNTGLLPTQESLSAWPVSSDTFVYPCGANPQPYNTSACGGASEKVSCKLADLTYTIHFDDNGSTSGSMGDLAMTYDVAKPLSANKFSKSKYQFDGWNTQADGSGEAYTDKQEVSNLTNIQGKKVILYAQWKRVVSMTLATNGRAGAGYVLSATEGDREHGVDNVYTDSGKKNKASWPQMAPSSGTLMLYGLTPGTYYLYNTQAPAGYLLSNSHSFTINDKSEVVIDGQGEPKELTNDKIIVSFSFTPAPDLPQTGSSERGLLQGLGVLLALGITGVAVRTLRRKIKG